MPKLLLADISNSLGDVAQKASPYTFVKTRLIFLSNEQHTIRPRLWHNKVNKLNFASIYYFRKRFNHICELRSQAWYGNKVSDHYINVSCLQKTHLKLSGRDCFGLHITAVENGTTWVWFSHAWYLINKRIIFSFTHQLIFWFLLISFRL